MMSLMSKFQTFLCLIYLVSHTLLPFIRIEDIFTDPVKLDPCKYRFQRTKDVWSNVKLCKNICDATSGYRDSDNSCDFCYDDLGCRVQIFLAQDCIDFRCNKKRPGKSTFVLFYQYFI